MAQIKAFFVTLDQPGQKYAKAALLCQEDPEQGACSSWVRSPTEFAALKAVGAEDQTVQVVDQAIFDQFPLRPGSLDPRTGQVVPVH